MLNGMLIYMVKDLFITDTTHITEQPFVMLKQNGHAIKKQTEVLLSI